MDWGLPWILVFTQKKKIRFYPKIQSSVTTNTAGNSTNQLHYLEYRFRFIFFRIKNILESHTCDFKKVSVILVKHAEVTYLRFAEMCSNTILLSLSWGENPKMGKK